MNSRLTVLSILAVLPFAACDRKSPTVSATNVSQEEVNQKVAAATDGGAAPVMKPGRWEGALTMHELDLPNLPPEVKQRMKSSTMAPKTFVTCITAEDVKSKKAFFTGDAKDKSCTYDRFNMGGGKIDAAMHCTRPQSKMAMTMTGIYTPESYQMDMASKAQGPSPTATMSMKMTVAARRVGQCRGSQDEG